MLSYCHSNFARQNLPTNFEISVLLTPPWVSMVAKGSKEYKFSNTVRTTLHT